MAVNDAVNGILVVGIGAAGTFQPAAGVEVCITEIDRSGAAATQTVTTAALYDGTNLTGAWRFDGSTNVYPMNRKLWVTNTIYLRVLNNVADVMNWYYSGVQTK